MRSMKIKLGVVAVAGATMVLAAMTTSAGAAGPVGSGTASATKAICGMGTGKKATGAPIKLGGIDMLIPGVDFTTMGKFANAYFKCVNDNGGINGRPIKYTLYNEAAQPDAGGIARQEADRERQGRRRRRQHELRRVRHQLEVLQVQGLRRDRRRRAGRVLQHAELRRGQHGPALQQHRRRAARSSRSGRSRSSSHRPTRSRHTPTAASLKVAKAAGIQGQVFPIKLPITDANSTILKLVQAAGDGGGVILDYTPDSAPALDEGRDRAGPRRQGAVGLVDADRQRVHGGAVPAVRRQDAHQPGVRLASTTARPDEVLYGQITKKYAPKIADPELRPDGLPGRQVRDHGAAQRQGAGDREVVQQRGPGAQEHQDGHALQAVVRRERSPYHIPNNTDITVTYKTARSCNEDQVLRDPGCRSADRADPQVGEEVQPEHGQVARNE